MKKELFGKTIEHQDVHVFVLTNTNGMKVVVSDFGATLIELWVPDKKGILQDVVLGYDNLADYQSQNDCYLGATVGRNANRVEDAVFDLAGKTYKMNQNEGINNLHSGPNGFHLRQWDIKEIDEENNKITFQLESPNGDQGFPGNLKIEASYQLTQENQLVITYSGVSDQSTVFNPTNHSYFNLNGHANGKILSHRLQLNSCQYTPVKDEHAIPTGTYEYIEGTPMDFRELKPIEQDLDLNFLQLGYTKGYDHNFVLDKALGTFDFCSKVIGDKTGIKMTVETNLPCVQFYAGNGLDQIIGKNGTTYGKNAGFCLETQFAPNAINQSNFTQPILPSNTNLSYQTCFTFDLEN